MLNFTVSLFPNTGHQYVFLALPADLLEANEGLKSDCENDVKPWLPIPEASWIRRRFGKREGALGLWLAVESNLGDARRGWIYEPGTRLNEHEIEGAIKAAAESPPYAYVKETDLPTSSQQQVEFAVADLPFQYRIISLTVNWLKPGAETVAVDLIVDFGNTRTIVLALENRRTADGSLSGICKPLRLGKRGESYRSLEDPEGSGAIFDSWFVLHEPLFSDFEPDVSIGASLAFSPMVEVQLDTPVAGIMSRIFGRRNEARSATVVKRAAQIFVELSPAILGLDATESLARQENLGAAGSSFLSSPKRYLCDNDPVGSLAVTGAGYWTMNLNRWHSVNGQLVGESSPPGFACTMLRFLDENGNDWSLGDDGRGNPPNERIDPNTRPFPKVDKPHYPRADSMTWCALTVIEAAFRQINSLDWRREMGVADVPRVLRSIQVTYPPGWSGALLELYRKKWQKALDVFCLTHLPNRILVGTPGGTRPTLHLEIDEAVASQLPYVFGEIQRFNTGQQNWLSLVGRGQGKAATARVLNIDIGGGTTDIAIVSYQNRADSGHANLVAELLFSESSTIAGDLLVRRAIEMVLLPRIASIFGNDAASKTKKTRFEGFMSGNKGANQNSWNRITRQVFIPIVRWWLTNLSAKQYGGECPAKMIERGSHMVQPEILGRQSSIGFDDQSFNKLCEKENLGPNLLPWDQVLHYEESRLCEAIEETFESLFRSVTKLVEAFDCDLVLVSGKPSELPFVQDLLIRHLPLTPQRIVFSKDTFVGHWYPLSNDGFVHDAKCVTVAGAALYRAIKSGAFPTWSIERKVSPNFIQRNQWGLMPQDSKLDFGKLLLDSKDDEKLVDLMIQDRIGRRLLPSISRPEPMYRLMWRDRKRINDHQAGALPTLSVTLRRSNVQAGEDAPPAEVLEMIDVVGLYNGAPVSLTDVELQLWTMDSNEYWMDAGRFQVEWA